MRYSVAEAKNKLPELIDRALRGEEVVVTRHGNPVVELKGLNPAPKPLTDEHLDWLAKRRAGRGHAKTDAGIRASKMRDEDWR